MSESFFQPWNDTRREFPRHVGPIQLFEEQVARTPDATALVMGPKKLSYRGLNDKANQLAGYLRQQGVTPESRVGVFMDRSVDIVVSFLAILKSGGVYLPLDPSFPKERLAFMLADAKVALLLTHSSNGEAFRGSSVRLVFLDELEGKLSAFSPENLALLGKPEDLAYQIYTSGSTGNPKGVMIPRRALSNFLLSMAEVPGISSSDRLLGVTTISFDISILELLLPLTTGAQLSVATREQAFDAAELKRLLQAQDITLMQATPTTWRMLVESGWEGKSNLRILCGGEALTSDLARKLLPRCAELWNMYGPTETTIWSSIDRVTSSERISLGAPIANTQFFVVHEQGQPVATGESGELWIGGEGVACGYLNRPELTAEKFIPDRFSSLPGARLYRTGDEVRLRPDGSLEFIGRLDHQVKLNGFRIELGEIESNLAAIGGISQAVVLLREDRPGERRLVAYYTGSAELSSSQLIQALKSNLPDYMIPAAFLHVEQFPLTPNAKLDRKALPPPERKRPLLSQEFIAPRTALENELAGLWGELLQLDEIGIDDSFFELGGNSLGVVRMVSLYHARFGKEIPPVKVFQYPTVAQLCGYLEAGSADSSFLKDAERRVGHSRSQTSTDSHHEDIAVIGMAGRFPGAENLDQLWRNLCNGVESISVFTPEELGPGIDESLRRDPDYIRARGLIEGAELFDASFFGINALEAKVMDPQQRVFLELTYHALEIAGYDPDRFHGYIGVFAGIGDNHYYTTNLLTHPDLLAMAGKLAVEYGNQKDYIALRAAYLLDLRGPAVSLNTACSTTLLAIDQASRSLLDGECDIALAGGIDITVPQKSGFLYQEGGTFAKDGHCRPFDADATGTMFCDGAGIVVLKRLSEALRDGDMIYAVLKGTGKNNNGARPASFLAPSVEGQAEAIALAQARANVPVDTIGYIETHGTGTPVGDPIEFEALCNVFRAKTDKKQFCYIGSIKGNIGHPTNAAGVAGFIKAAMVLHKEQIPATLHFRKPNPRIDFDGSPFLIADKLIPFSRGPEPRRTAVSSFGFGGTNIHAILEEAPLRRPGSASRPLQLLPLSARTPTALESSSRSLAEYLSSVEAEGLADISFTLHLGRKQMAQRRFVVAGEPLEAAKLLRQPNPLRCSSKRCERRNPPIVFLFGGQGTQYVNMGRNLYEGESLFRAVVDDCCRILKPHLGRDLRELLYPQSGDEKTAQISLQDTFFTQPSIFVIEYALARLWQSFGIQPAMMAGHSIGEFVAATLAGVWELEDALHIIALRGRLMQDLPRGSMMAVSSSAENVQKLLPPSLQIASNNSPSLCVVSGPEREVQSLQKQLEAGDITCRHLHTSHAFHSAMMEPMVEPLREAIAKVSLQPPSKPFVSTVTGLPITAAECTNPAYWAHHARATVEFSKAVQYLKSQGFDLFLESGPRSTLCSLTRQHFSPSEPCTAIPSLGDTHENNTEWATLLFALGSLWQNGVSIDWDAFYANEDRRRVPLPTYPFERERYWVDPAPVVRAVSVPATLSTVQATTVPTGNTAPVTGNAESASSMEPRKVRIAARLLDVLVPISGRDRSQLSDAATFLEQGFDSLSLTQVAFAIKKEFGVKISFSQLMNQFPNVDLVAEHLDGVLTADQFALPALQAVAPKPADPSPAPATVSQQVPAQAISSGNSLEAVVAEQARTISRLLGMLEKWEAERRPTPQPSGVARQPLDRDVTPAPPPPPAHDITVDSTVPQRGIFFSSRLSNQLSSSYNESVTLRLTGSISVSKLNHSLQRLIQRHEALRASFDEDGKRMHIAAVKNIEFPLVDLSGVADSSAREEHLRQLISQESATPFVLPAGPLFRSRIVLLSDNAAAVILTAHHVICDGWSLDVLIHNFCAFYSEELSGVPVPLLPVESFSEYARNGVAREQSPEFNEACSFWRSQFSAGFPSLVLPTDHPRTTRRSYAAHRLARTIPASVVQKLREFGKKNGCSLFVMTLGALALLLARVSRQRRYVLALPSAEQPSFGQTDLVGHCVNLLPFLVDLREEETVRTYLARVQSELATAQDHTAFALVNLLEDLHSSSAPKGVAPVSAGLTSIKQFHPQELPQSGFSVVYDGNPKSFESFEWYLNVIEDGDELRLHCHFDSDLFEDTTVLEWLAVFEGLLLDIASDPSLEVVKLAKLKRTATAPSAEFALSNVSHPEHAIQNHDDSSDPPVTALKSPETPAVAPVESEAALLRALLVLWSRVLDVPTVGPDDDFFALGGHSMTAAKLFAAIERELGHVAPLATLYTSSTPRALAHLLSKDAQESSWQSLVPIQSSGGRPPLFLVHAAEGNVLLYRSLAAYLGPDQPVYGLQSAGLDGKFPLDAKFENVAQRYIQEIRQVQPTGPYMLGGYCLGGTLAMEMARQLMSAGETVGLVALIEAYNIRSIPWPLPWHLRAVNRCVLNPYFHLWNLFAAQGTGKWKFFQEKLRVEISRARVTARVSWARAIRPFLPRAAEEFHHIRVADLYERALEEYDVKPFPGELTVLQPERQLAGFSDPSSGWASVAQGGLQLFTLPIAPRGSLVEPYVGQLAETLRECIDRGTARSHAVTAESELEFTEPRR